MSRFTSVFSLLLAGVWSDLAKASTRAADTVFYNGSIYSLDEYSSKFQAMAIKDGRITYLGNDKCVKQFTGPDTTVIDLEGRMAMPGLVDAHMHLLTGGAGLLQCNLNYQPLDLNEVLDHIQQCLDSEEGKEDTDWLEVIYLDIYHLSDVTGGVTKKDLDTLKTNRPVVVQSADRHTSWVNTAALEASDITASTPSPPGGIIERLTGSQEPSGLLQDNAADLLSGPAPPTAEDNIQSAKAALKLLREQGLTGFQDAASNIAIAKALEAVKEEGALSARGFFDYRIEAPNSTADIMPLVREVVNVTSTYNDPADLDAEPSLKWHAVKIFTDGVILYPANTGALLEPYLSPVDNSTSAPWEPNPDIHPEPYWSTELLSATLEQLFKENIDAQIHVDGDGAVRVALDAVEGFRQRNPGYEDYKVGLAHNEVTDPSDWPRFAELKAVPIMSFQWAQASSVWIPNTLKSMGPERSQYLEAWGDIARFGTRVVYGSDWPIDPLDEWLAIKVGVTRSGDHTNPNSPASQDAIYNTTGLAGLSLSREAALRAITIESSEFLRAGDDMGSLEVGKLADVIVLKANYFEVPDEELARQKTLLTMVGGEVMYIADDVDFGDGVTAKFPNNDAIDALMEKRTVGGAQGRSLSVEGQGAVRKHRKRNVCDHGINFHKHMH